MKKQREGQMKKQREGQTKNGVRDNRKKRCERPGGVDKVASVEVPSQGKT